jgi:hypothetical protein
VLLERQLGVAVQVAAQPDDEVAVLGQQVGHTGFYGRGVRAACKMAT